MARVFRFYVPPDRLHAGLVTLEPDESHHALHVARIRAGERVEVFDGRGGLAQCEVREAGKRDARLEVLSVEREPEPEHSLTICVAFPNRERALERIVESCVPLGVTEFRLFHSDHSERRPKYHSRWDRWAREACKQCLLTWMPRFCVAADLDDALAPAEPALILLLDPAARCATLPAELDGSRACTCVVGPEGGLSERETGVAVDRGSRPITLGRHILRTELACTTIASLVSYQWRAAQGLS